MSSWEKDRGDPLARVLFVLGDFPARTQTFILRELREMRRRGHAVNVLALDAVERDDLDAEIAEIAGGAIYAKRAFWKGSRTAGPAAEGASPTRECLRRALALPHRTLYHRGRFLVALGLARRLAPLVRERGFRYIHAHFAAFQAELAMCLSWLTGIPYGMTEHAYGLWRDRNLIPQKVAGARLVLTCTAHNVAALERLAPEHTAKIALARHGIELDEWRPGPDLRGAGDPPGWLAVGRLIPKKGFEHLVDAVGILRDGGREIRVDIVGDGPERSRLAQRIERRGLQESVSLVGEIPNAEVRERLRLSHGLVMPSVRDKRGDLDGIPNVVLEAMASARPVVGSAISGIPEAVRDGENGLLVPPGDAQALARALERLSVDRDLAARCGAAGRATVEREFDVRAAVGKQLDLIARAVEGA